MNRFTPQFWQERYEAQQTGWDAGGPTTPFVEFFKTLTNKDLHILIPGCGRAYEGELLHQLGFKHVVLLDFAEAARIDFLTRVPSFPPQNFLLGDFFAHQGQYDLILEQTFFCALEPQLRTAYAQKMLQLLKPGGHLVGVLFTFPLTEQGPPFGGSTAEYSITFSPQFVVQKLEPCINSIKPREGNEVFIKLQKPTAG